MDMNKLKKLIELVRASGIAELEIADNDEKIRITNAPSMAQSQIYTLPPASVATSSPHSAPMSTNPSASAPVANTASSPTVDHRKFIKSPMVGTFYRSSAPGAKPLVEVGQAIKKGQKVCIIEAMKLMNEIEAECDGVIKEVLVQNEQPVEYGEPLFVME